MNLKAILQKAGTWDRAALALLILFFLVKLPLLGLPLYWDEPAYMDERLYNLGAWKIFLPWNTESLGLNNHPPGQQLFLYVFGLFLPDSVWSAHFVSLLLTVNFLVFSYIFLKDHFGSKLALTANLFFITTPIAFAMSTQWLPDLPNLSLAVTALALYQRRAWKWFVAAALLLGLISESSLGYLLGIFLYACFEKLTGKVSWKGVLYAAAGHASIVFFFVKKKFLLGAFTNHPAILQREKESGFNWLQISGDNMWAFESYNAFIGHNNGWLLTALFFVLAVYLAFFRRRDWAGLLPVALFAGIFYAFFFIYGDYHPRNIMPVYYFFSVLAAYGVVGLVETAQIKHGTRWLALAVALMLARNVSVNLRPFSTGDSNIFTYVNETRLCQKTVDWLVENQAPGPLYASFPIAFFLEDTRSGYLDRPFHVVAYYPDGQWRRRDRVRTQTAVKTNIEGGDHVKHINEYLEKRFQLIKEIEHKGVKAWIFTRVSQDDKSDTEGSGQ